MNANEPGLLVTSPDLGVQNQANRLGISLCKNYYKEKMTATTPPPPRPPQGTGGTLSNHWWAHPRAPFPSYRWPTPYAAVTRRSWPIPSTFSSSLWAPICHPSPQPASFTMLAVTFQISIPSRWTRKSNSWWSSRWTRQQDQMAFQCGFSGILHC